MSLSLFSKSQRFARKEKKTFSHFLQKKNFSRRRKFFLNKMIWHSKQASEETQDGEVSQAQNI